MKFSKTFSKRLFGKIKQNKHLPYQFHLLASAGFKSTKKDVNEKLMNDIIEWGGKYGIKIDTLGEYNPIFGYTFVIRDHRAIEVFSNASKGYFKDKDGEMILIK